LEDLEDYSIDFLQKSGKGKRGRGKGTLIFLFPFTFNLFPPLAKGTFARGLMHKFSPPAPPAFF
jgi:hypothetical protein